MQIRRNKKRVSDQMLDAFLREYEATTTLSESGQSYNRSDFRDFYEILPDAFDVTPVVSRSEAIRLFAKALRNCRRAETMDSESIVSEATKLLRGSLAISNELFTLWTKFRARDMSHCPGFALTWRGVKVRTAANLPGWLRPSKNLLRGFSELDPSVPKFYGHIILSCEERNEDRAVDRMMDALQLILGLLNLYESYGRNVTRYSGKKNWPDGKLWPGPYQFVFRKREFCGKERFWYNPSYDQDAWDLSPPPTKSILEVVPRTRKALAALTTHPLSEVLIRAIMLLQDGFETRDSSHRLLRYWCALEQLYVEPDAKGRSNEKVFERAVFAELEPEISRWKLEHIARLRNDYVHAGKAGDDLDRMCQYLRDLLARHINHWIFRGHDLGDHAALLQLVKLPPDRAALVQMREMIDRRLAYLDGP